MSVVTILIRRLIRRTLQSVSRGGLIVRVRQRSFDNGIFGTRVQNPQEQIFSPDRCVDSWIGYRHHT